MLYVCKEGEGMGLFSASFYIMYIRPSPDLNHCVINVDNMTWHSYSYVLGMSILACMGFFSTLSDVFQNTLEPCPLMALFDVLSDSTKFH